MTVPALAGLILMVRVYPDNGSAAKDFNGARVTVITGASRSKGTSNNRRSRRLF